MAEPGERPGGPGPPYFETKKNFLETGPPLISGGWMTAPPPSSEGLNPPLLREKLQLIDMRKHTTAAHS